MLSQNQRLLRETEAKIAELGQEAEAIEKRAAEDNRSRTDEENQKVADLHSKIVGLKSDTDKLKEQITLDEDIHEAVRLGKAEDKGTRADAKVVHEPAPSVGAAFVASEGYKRIKDASNRTGTWSSGGVEVGGYRTKGTLTEAAGSASGLLPVPQVVGGVVDTLFQRNVFANLLGSGTVGMNVNSIRYTVEGTATSGAAGVAEGGTKPESTLGLSTKDESIKKIATLLPVSEETLEDAAQVESYINARLSLFIKNREDLDLIRAASGGNDPQGIIGRTGVNIYGGGTAAGNKAEQIFKAVNGVRGSAFTDPNWIVLNPSDYQDLRLLKDANNQYFGGGPWSGQYGVGGQTDPGRISLVGSETLWGTLTVYVTANIGAGTALAGNSQDAVVWRKGGIRVDASNSHSTYFADNLVAIRAEERLALAVYRPASYVEIRLA